MVAANRDELLARPTDPPLLLTEQPPRWGGRDRLAGGTWLAVDPAGRVGAVTNRHPGGRPPTRDGTRRSRGDLPLEVLRGDDATARQWASWARGSALQPGEPPLRLADGRLVHVDGRRQRPPHVQARARRPRADRAGRRRFHRREDPGHSGRCRWRRRRRPRRPTTSSTAGERSCARTRRPTRHAGLHPRRGSRNGLERVRPRRGRRGRWPPRPVRARRRAALPDAVRRVVLLALRILMTRRNPRDAEGTRRCTQQMGVPSGGRQGATSALSREHR